MINTFFIFLGILAGIAILVYCTFLKWRTTLLCKMGMHESECFLLDNNLVLRCRHCMSVVGRRIEQL